MPILLVIKTTFLFSTMFSTKIPFDETDSKNLREYKYHAGAYTPLDTFLSKLADKLINWVPKCLSPNAITLIGLSCNLFGVVLLHLFGDEDSWRARLSFFISASMALFYMFMDFLDGKQARRLGCSSPLGQLFDHGCDSLNIHLVLYAVIKSLGVTNMRQIALLFGVCGFMFASFQIIEYYDDVLMFGLSFFGVSEAEVMSVLISLITSIFGVSFWQVPIPFYPSIRLCDCLVYAFIIGIGGCVFLKNVKYLFKGTTITEEDRGRKTIGYMDHVKRYVPLITMVAILFYLSNTPLMEKYPNSVLILAILPFSHYAIYVTIHHLCRKDLPCNFLGHILLFILLVLVRRGIEIDSGIMTAFVVVACIIYLVFVVNFIVFFQKTLNIGVFATKFTKEE